MSETGGITNIECHAKGQGVFCTIYPIDVDKLEGCDMQTTMFYMSPQQHTSYLAHFEGT